MDKNLKVGGILIIGVILLASAFVYFFHKKNEVASLPPLPTNTASLTSSTTPATPPLPGTATNTSKTYSGTIASFMSVVSLTKNVDTAKQYIGSVKGLNEKLSFVEIYIDDAKECFLGFCTKPALKKVTINGIQWDFLGNPEYCNGTECSQPSAVYRTERNGTKAYLAFYAYGPKLDEDTILKTFKFK